MTKEAKQNEHAFVLSTVSFLLALHLTRAESNADRKAKKGRVTEKKCAAVESAFADIMANRHSSQMPSVVKNILSTWNSDDKTLLLIDLAFADPFFPYELQFHAKEFENVFVSIAALIGYEEALAKQILATKKDALKAHKETVIWKMLVAGSAVAVVCALGGWVAAPYLATVIGGAAGLTGAAATSYGLALLGGGSLAAGGMGMAGGLWIVTGVSAAVAGGLMTGGQLLYSMGADQARAELIKLQVSFKEVLLHSQVQIGKAKEAITVLEKDKRDIEKALNEEKLLNESNGARVKDLEQKLKAIQTSIQWMEKERATA